MRPDLVGVGLARFGNPDVVVRELRVAAGELDLRHVATGAILGGRGITVVLSSGDILLLTVGGLVGVALWGAIGAGLGAIIHNQVGGVITLLAWGLVVDSLLFGLVPAVGRFTPTRASDALMGLRAHHLVSPGAGAITLVAWAVALGVAGAVLSVRQDIN